VKEREWSQRDTGKSYTLASLSCLSIWGREGEKSTERTTARIKIEQRMMFPFSLIHSDVIESEKAEMFSLSAYQRKQRMNNANGTEHEVRASSGGSSRRRRQEGRGEKNDCLVSLERHTHSHTQRSGRERERGKAAKVRKIIVGQIRFTEWIPVNIMFTRVFEGG